jgi:AbrB family looped-hinge helix DNA binding protein
VPTATVTSKGQITLPKEIRDALSVHPGDRVMFWRNPPGQVVVEAETRSLMSLKGVLKGKRKGVTVEEMNEAIAQGVADANS